MQTVSYTHLFSIQNDRQKVAIAQDGQKEAMEHAGRTGGLPFVGVGWYRLDFEAPAFTKGKSCLLYTSNVAELTSGVYIVKMEYNNVIRSQKLLKQ